MFETFPPYSTHAPSFHISYYPLTIILVSAPTSSFTLAVSMREVYTHLVQEISVPYSPY